VNHSVHHTLVNFIWNVADDVLRDIYVRGKYRDVILPMIVIRRLDVLLEDSKEDVLKRHQYLEELKIPPEDQVQALEEAAGYSFYNISPFTLQSLPKYDGKTTVAFKAYLAGFSPNVQVIIEKFKFRNQIDTLVEHGRLGLLLQKFTTREINLSPKPIKNDMGEVLRPGLTNLGMGHVFEELIRRFNEENNEEAGEHFTPRDIIQLMTHLIFLPIKDEIQSGAEYQVYDPACGSGGMLTEAEDFLQKLTQAAGKENNKIELFGQEVKPGTFAICQSDMLIKRRNPSNIKYGSTLSSDDFPGKQFDFMLANPPYGKSWKGDMDALQEGQEGRKKEVRDTRYIVALPGLAQDKKLPLIPRSNDGQLLFLVNMLHRMKQQTVLGSRIAVVHNGSALFTGDAGQGESNIRQWIIEHDWLEAIIALPLDMFYNTGIATYIWLLSNKKPEHRRGKIQLIDATNFYKKLRKNLGKKNCQLTSEHIETITQLFLDFRETPASKICDNADFGYHSITIERPLRLTTHVTAERMSKFKATTDARLHPLANALQAFVGQEPHKDFNHVRAALETYVKQNFFPLQRDDFKVLCDAFTEKDETAEPIIKKHTKTAISYESDAELRDTEKVPLTESIEHYFAREVLLNVPDACIDHTKTVKGYEILFNKYFYKYQPLRSLAEITADILALEMETKGLLSHIVSNKEEMQ